MKTNATFILERLDGGTATEIWHERIEVKYGSGAVLREDEYGAYWLYWGIKRLGLFDPKDALRTRATVTFDTKE